MTEHTFVGKWLSFGAAVMDRGVSKSDLRVLWWIFNHANHEHIAWPSTRGLARRAGINHRNIGRHLSRLVETGYVEIVRKGSQHGDANHYRLTFKGVEDMKSLRLRAPVAVTDTISVGGNPVVHSDDTRGAIQADVTLSSPLTRGVVNPDAGVLSALTTKPPTEPAHKAGEVVVGEQLRNGAQGAVLAVATDPRVATEAFQRFAGGYPPNRGNMADAETVFMAALAAGASVEVIVSQGAAYAAWCKADRTQLRFIKWPMNWLREEFWVRDWSVKPTSKRAKDSMRAPLSKTLPTEKTAAEDATEKLHIAGEHQSARPQDAGPTQEENEAAQQFARSNYGRFMRELASVDTDLPLGDKTRRVLEYACRKNKEELLAEHGADEITEVSSKIDEVLSCAERDEWGDADGYDKNGDFAEAGWWFGLSGQLATYLIAQATAYAAGQKARAIRDRGRDAAHGASSRSQFATFSGLVNGAFGSDVPFRKKLCNVVQRAFTNNAVEASTASGHSSFNFAFGDVTAVLEGAQRDEWGDADGRDDYDLEVKAATWFGPGSEWAKLLLKTAAEIAHESDVRSKEKYALRRKTASDLYARLKKELSYFDADVSDGEKLKRALAEGLRTHLADARASTSHYGNVEDALLDVDDVLADAAAGNWGSAECLDEQGNLALAGKWFTDRGGKWAWFVIDRTAVYADWRADAERRAGKHAAVQP